MPAIDLQSSSQLEGLGNGLIVLDFWATWCAPCGQMNTLFDQLAEQYTTLKFAKVEAEQLSDVTEKFSITAVPSFVFIKNGKVIEKIEGADSPALAQQVSFYSQVKGGQNGAPSSAALEGEDLNSRLKRLINQSPVVLFMKGSPEAPQCGFSRKIVDVLKPTKYRVFFVQHFIRRGSSYRIKDFLQLANVSSIIY